MTFDRLLEYCLAKPGAWRDEPWEGNTVAKVDKKDFAFVNDVAVGSKTYEDFTSGFAYILSGLKTFVETGQSLPAPS